MIPISIRSEIIRVSKNFSTPLVKAAMRSEF
jgi:hypothetical protein